MARFSYAIRASMGRRRYQEDAAATWPGGGACLPADLVARLPPARDGELYAVLADGMGGHVGGALASSLACAAFLFNLTRTVGPIEPRLEEALQVANAAIAAKAGATPQLNGMGTTLVGVHLSADGISWTSVGDSPLYVCRRGSVIQVNEDHSMAPVIDRLVADGAMTPEEGEADGRRHMLRSALTGEVLDMVDATRQPFALEVADYVVLASDGLDTLSDDDIAGTVIAFDKSGAEAVADGLINATISAGDPHQDNVTVIVIRVEDASR